MSFLPTQLPPLKLPLIPIQKEDWMGNPMLPPIHSLHPSPSSCSLSSFSSPESLSIKSFNPDEPRQKKGSIKSLLNSGTELLALDRKTPFKRRQLKGLRLFSKQVSDKVAQKGITTYNEVADELSRGDQKNIRRRVYDALNVLMALGMIAKDRKQIRWLGLPGDRDRELERQIRLEEERQEGLVGSVRLAKRELAERLGQVDRLGSLIDRNRVSRLEPVCPVYLPLFVLSSDDPVQVSQSGQHQAIVQLGSCWNIYQDSDVLSALWPSTISIA